MFILVKNTLATLFFLLFTNLCVVRHSAVETGASGRCLFLFGFCFVFLAGILAKHEEMRFHPDLNLFASPFNVCFVSVQVAVVVISNDDALRRQGGAWALVLQTVKPC